MNQTSSMYVDEYWLKFDPVNSIWHKLILITYCIFGTVGIIGNLLVIIFYIKFESLRTYSFYFVLNLAVADFFLLAVNVPLAAISSYYEKWVFAQVGCNMYGVSCGISGFASIATMVFISIEKYLMIRNPFLTFKIKPKLLVCSIIGIWVYAIIWIIPSFFSPHGFVLEGFLTACSFDYISQDKYIKYNNGIMIIGGFLVPLVAIIVSYAMLLYKLGKREINVSMYNLNELNTVQSAYENRGIELKEILMHKQPRRTKIESIYGNASTSQLDVLDNENENESPRSEIMLDIHPKFLSTICCDIRQRRNANAYLRLELRVLRRSILTVLLFCVGWLPYAVIVFLAQYIDNRENYITPFTTSLPAVFAKMSAVYNPFLYSILQEKFIRHLKLLFYRFKRHVWH